MKWLNFFVADDSSNKTLPDDMSEQAILWISIPILLASLFYCSVVLMTWPYARPRLPLWILLLCILFPPFFPFLGFYLLFAFFLYTPAVFAGPREVIIVEASNRGRVTSAPVVRRARSASPRASQRNSVNMVRGPRSSYTFNGNRV